MKKRRVDPEQEHAAGCIIRQEDSQFVIASVVCSMIFINYGASAGSLGPALPALANHFHQPSSQMGFTFTSRGIGYLFGILLSGYVERVEGGMVTKDLIAAVSQVVCGLCLFLIDIISDYRICIALFVIQGCFFGIINTVTNILLPEMWGRRVGPWMQAMHSCFGIGAILGPACVGYFGYSFDFFLLSITSFLPCLILLLYHLVLSFTNPANSHYLVSMSTVDSNSSSKRGRDAPLILKILVSAFFMFYVGAEAGYAGWISSYSLLEGITSSQSEAAYLSSIFWAALTLGRVTAIPLAIFLSSMALIRLQLFLAVVSGGLCVTVLPVSYLSACIVSAFSGYALSAMFPVMITIFSDYGYRVDSTSTSMFMIGATLGESAIPVVIGLLMGDSRPFMMPIAVFGIILVMLALYIAFDCLSEKETQVDQGKVVYEAVNNGEVKSGEDYEGVDYEDDDIEMAAFEEIEVLDDEGEEDG